MGWISKEVLPVCYTSAIDWQMVLKQDVYNNMLCYFINVGFLNKIWYLTFLHTFHFFLVLYGCETWSLTLREESRLRVFENRILRSIFGSKRDENGEWKRLHNEELHSLYSSPNIARVIKFRWLRWAEHVVRMEEGNSAFKILTGKPTGKRHLGRPRRWWEDSIRMDL